MEIQSDAARRVSPPSRFRHGKERWALLSRQIVFSTQQGVVPLLHQKLLEVGHGLRVLLSVSVAMWQGGWPSVTSKCAENVFRHVKEGPLLVASKHIACR